MRSEKQGYARDAALNLLMRQAHRTTTTGARFFYASADSANAKAAFDILSSEAEHHYAPGDFTVSRAHRRLDFTHNGATITVFDARNPRAMYGVSPVMAVFDEAARISPGDFASITHGCLALTTTRPQPDAV